MSGRVKGFRFAGVHGGVKAGDALDLGLVFAEEPAVASGVFTKNRVQSRAGRDQRAPPPKSGLCQAILVNSGNANACTGKPGRQAALALTRAAAAALHVPTALVVPASTGLIGAQLPAGEHRGGDSHARRGSVRRLARHGLLAPS